MKNYEKPYLEIEEMKTDDVVLASLGLNNSNLGIGEDVDVYF